MNDMIFDRRGEARQSANADIAILHGDDEMLARLKDLSPSGVQFEVDCLEMDSVSDAVHAIRLQGFPALDIKLVWGIGDLFGAEFTAPPEQVAHVVSAYCDPIEA
ncbi:MAG: PilZ domain-containing protein [Maritimibacter sp.]